MLDLFVNADGGDYRGRTIPCEKGHWHEFIDFRDKKLLTMSLFGRRVYQETMRRGIACAEIYVIGEGPLDMEYCG